MASPKCTLMTVENSSDARTVVGIEVSHSWKVRTHEEFGRGIEGVLVTMDCQRCGTEKSILMIQDGSREKDGPLKKLESIHGLTR